MKSKTKYDVDNATIVRLCEKAGFKKIDTIAPLTAGEFNSAFSAIADGKEIVIKIAPKSFENTLTYERDIMAREVEFYAVIKENCDVKIPKIYFYDNSKTLIPSEYFIMERLKGQPLSHIQLSSQEKSAVNEKIGEMVAALHAISGEKFGYVQNALFDNWYLAIKSMTENLIADCKKARKSAGRGHRLIEYIEKFKSVLQGVPSVYTHFDIWAGNIFCEKIGDEFELTLIDTERSFWGDGIGDFVSIEMMKDLANKKDTIKGYNHLAKAPISLSHDEHIRFGIMTAYLALIVHTEKFYRYKRTQTKYGVNCAMARILFKKAFKNLK